jgi:hypothetical protein
MSISRKITGDASGGSGGSGKYVDDVFSTYLYEGDQTTSSRQIVNGIDLDDKGGLVWIKERSQDRFHFLFDTERGEGYRLSTNSTEAESSFSNESLQSFNSDGFTIGDFYGVSETGEDFASWSFAKQEGFFDVVTWTGDYVFPRQIPHNLGSTPGMVIIKKTSGSEYWMVRHSALPELDYIWLNENDAAGTSNDPDGKPPFEMDDTHLTFDSQIWSNYTNASGAEYVAYLFADDAPMFGPDGDESIIKCGSYTGTGVAGLEIDLGWEPQYVLLKNADYASDWYTFDTMRGIVTGGVDSILKPNVSNAESASSNSIEVTPTGFTISTGSQGWNKAGSQFIYMAIRRPMKPAEEFEPEELFAVEEATGSVLPQFKSGFPVDFAFRRSINGALDTDTSARLIQGKRLKTNTNAAADNDSSAYFDFMNGWRDSGSSGSTVLSWMFRRAPGFFDVVTYAGDSVAGREVPHNLGVAPEMMWVKSTGSTNWGAYNKATGGTEYMNVDNDNPSYVNDSFWNDTDPTDEHFTLANKIATNGSGYNYIAFLWASVPGICDIGSYTGNGDYQDIDCGFTNGARFVLLKRTDSYGDWMYFDTLRGISNSNSPMLQLNTTAAQNTASFIRPFSGGFQVTANPTGIASATYIYIAIA